MNGNRNSYGWSARQEGEPTVTSISSRVKAISAEEGIKLAREWDFPRPIEEYEHWAHWFKYKDRIVWWINRVVSAEEFPVFEIHIAADPYWRGRIPIPKLLDSAERFVLNRVKQPGIFAVKPLGGGIEPYLGRLGFTFSDRLQVWYKTFGDFPHG